jgi:hypothetical protein
MLERRSETIGTYPLARKACRVVFVKEGDMQGLARILTSELDCFAPRGFLTAVEFAKEKNLPLKDTRTRDAAVFDDPPMDVSFAILAAFLTAKEHC